MLHRTHLLCLLARGLLYDQAASDPVIQVKQQLAFCIDSQQWSLALRVIQQPCIQALYLRLLAAEK